MTNDVIKFTQKFNFKRGGTIDFKKFKNSWIWQKTIEKSMIEEKNWTQGERKWCIITKCFILYGDEKPYYTFFGK